VKVCSDAGSCPDSAVADGIVWAANNGANVINLSLGGQYSNAVLADAVAYAWSRGAVVVASSGNCGDSSFSLNGCTYQSPPSYPAAYPNVIGVAATTQGDERAPFSTYGPHVDIAAPGVSILSTYWNWFWGSTYEYEDGTSMSAPFVSGAAAVVWSRAPWLTNAQVVSLLLGTADDLGPTGWDDQYGYGLVNLRSAIEAAQSGSVPAVAEAHEAVRILAADEGAAVTAGRVVVKLRSGVNPADVAGILSAAGASYDGPMLLARTHRIVVAAGAERSLAATLAASPLVEYAEPDYVLTLR
jgi:subtilisin family serine protease